MNPCMDGVFYLKTNFQLQPAETRQGTSFGRDPMIETTFCYGFYEVLWSNWSGSDRMWSALRLPCVPTLTHVVWLGCQYC